MNGYTLGRTPEGEVSVSHLSTPYSLHINVKPESWGRKVTPLHWDVYFQSQKGSLLGSITSRDLNHYKGNFPGLPLSMRLKYMEIGAGLGGFSPFIAELQHTGALKPVVVDPINYSFLQEMLQYAKANIPKYLRNEESVEYRQRGIDERLMVLIKRAEILADGKKVVHIQKRVEEAQEELRGLFGSFDVLVDYMGARLNSVRVREGRIVSSIDAVIKMEKRLVNKGGFIFAAGS